MLLPWLLVLHIATLLCWCGALLYLPALTISLARRRREGNGHPELFPVARRVFTHLATPAALLAILSGTMIFVVEIMAEAWLVIKLTLVSGLVICHVFTGRLTLGSERRPVRHTLVLGVSLGSASLLLIMGTLWLVLAEPL